jgi:nucleoside 2-deoxyribosyltransferase
MKRVFISFAMEDKFARDNLVHQAEQSHTPFEFVDMSVRQPWSSSWKTQCRERIKQCDGVVAFISRNTPRADGACWEIKCAIEEGIPIRGFWVHRDDPCCRPAELGSTRVDYWTWDNVTNFINSL